MARDENNDTPLHSAASYANSKPGSIQALLGAGADPKLKNKYGKTPWDLAREHPEFRDTEGYWALNDARYN